MQNGREPWKQCRDCGDIFDPDVSHCLGCSYKDLEIISLTVEEVFESVSPNKVWTRHPERFYELLDKRRALL